MKTSVYVDGFNLYYGCLKKTSFKWLNLQVLCTNLLGRHHVIDTIRYFTAPVIPNDANPKVHLRQQVYLKALQTIDGMHIHYGRFSRHNKFLPLTSKPSEKVKVIRTEEKGTDVNFSVHLLNDAWKDRFDCAVLLTNDSDMAEAMRLVRSEFPDKRLGLITPSADPTVNLSRYAHFYKMISDHHLQQAQFASPLRGRSGRLLHKPRPW